MPQIINTNIASMNAQRNLNTSQSSLNQSLQRLSSGLRINSAKDDAAGLAISERMTSQIKGLNQASRNANDAISLAQTAEGALAEVTNNLQRIRELAVQSANSTNSAADRAALDQEVQQRLAEVDRAASQTAFNGLKILDGTFGTAAFQVGANVGETISVALSTSTRTSAIGKTADYVNGTTAYSSSYAVGQQGSGVDSSALATGDLAIQIGSNASIAVGASVDNSASGVGRTAASAYSKAEAINSAGIGNLTTQADTTAVFAWTDIASTTSTYSLTINSQAIYTAAGAGATLTGAQVAAAINAASGTSGVTASYSSTAGTMTLAASDGRNIVASQTAGSESTGEGLGATSATPLNNTVNDALTALTTASGVAVSATYVGTIRLTSTEAITLSGANETRIGYADASAMALGASALNTASVTSVANANTAISRVDSALASISTLRSTFGAIQNRFESAISNLQTTAENLSGARSRIQDADFAAETAVLTRGQILQQAGVAMLAQANSLPNNVLSLLR